MKDDIKRYIVIVLTMIFVFVYSVQAGAEKKDEAPVSASVDFSAVQTYAGDF